MRARATMIDVQTSKLGLFSKQANDIGERPHIFLCTFGEYAIMGIIIFDPIDGSVFPRWKQKKLNPNPFARHDVAFQMQVEI